MLKGERERERERKRHRGRDGRVPTHVGTLSTQTKIFLGLICPPKIRILANCLSM